MTSSARWDLAVKIGAGALLIPLALAFAIVALRPSPRQALKSFYAQGGSPENATPEESLVDPLVLAGDGVVPLLLGEVGNKGMPRRTYAIGFLGQGGYREALPLLVTIVEDPSETPAARAAALEAIWRIDGDSGRRLGTRYASERNTLGARAGSLLAGRQPAPRRTLFDAVVGWHN